MPTISLCMIVKNEEANLPDCLRPVRPLVNELVVVDTGSTDRTRDIAAQFDAKTFDFPWRDDFSAARNEALRHAQGDWIFCLDADDRLDDFNCQKLQRLFAQLSAPAAYTLLTVGDDVIGQHGVPMIRLFKRHPALAWEHRVHEQIAPPPTRLGYKVYNTDIQVRHTGYQSPELLQRKRERNLRLLQMDLADHPDSTSVQLHLGITLTQLQRWAEAVGPLEKCLGGLNPRQSESRFIFISLVVCLMALGQTERALMQCQRGLQWFPDDPNLRSGEQLLLANLQRFNVSPW